MSYYEGTYIDKLPLELQDKIGVPVVVGRLLALPVEVLDIILSFPKIAASRINRVMRGYLIRKHSATGHQWRDWWRSKTVFGRQAEPGWAGGRTLFY